MRVAIVTEVSTAGRNADVVRALEGRGLELLNVGMKHKDPDEPELTYINTGFLAALLLNCGRCDMVVGGCGTGQGFQVSVSQYAGVTCGHLLTPLDAWLFGRINAGNCVSLALNQGYGWGSDINLRLIFDQLFSVEHGAGYPEQRRESQKRSRGLLRQINLVCHRRMPDIVRELDDIVTLPALTYPGVLELLDLDSMEDRELAGALNACLGRAARR
ncbi:MAG: RpiB/LacA/LacB family sugar-phosphate isomerase [Candidatus Limnocylindrales bacterium]